MTLDKKHSINNILEENRLFPPSKEFSDKSNIKSFEELQSLKKQSLENPTKFWESFANSEIDWFEPFQTVLDRANAPFFKWFKEGKLNITYNCIDRHAKSHPDKTAIIWQGDEKENNQYISYKQLHHEVCKLANGFKSVGISKGDRVCIYMPMVPQAAYAMFACMRIGAIHSVVFGGFSPEAIKSRIQDADCQYVITANEGIRGGKKIPL